MRRLLVLSLFAFAPCVAQAMDAPSGQVQIDDSKILRGSFTEQHKMTGADAPMVSSGTFAVAPAHGLVWNIAQPFPTTTVVTPTGATQNIGGLVMKLPAKNLRHVYDMVGAALAGHWDALEKDFIVTRSGTDDHWQMLLTPRPDGNAKRGYATITVSGHHFVENIVMTKTDGSYDAFAFANEVLSPASAADPENVAFHQTTP